MNQGRLKAAVIFIILMAMANSFCGRYESSDASEQPARPEGWTENTHGNNVAPNYGVVFPRDRVNRIKITIPRPGDWERMEANMNELFAAQGEGTGPGVLEVEEI